MDLSWLWPWLACVGGGALADAVVVVLPLLNPVYMPYNSLSLASTAVNAAPTLLYDVPWIV